MSGIDEMEKRGVEQWWTLPAIATAKWLRLVRSRSYAQWKVYKAEEEDIVAEATVYMLEIVNKKTNWDYDPPQLAKFIIQGIIFDLANAAEKDRRMCRSRWWCTR